MKPDKTVDMWCLGLICQVCTVATKSCECMLIMSLNVLTCCLLLWTVLFSLQFLSESWMAERKEAFHAWAKHLGIWSYREKKKSGSNFFFTFQPFVLDKLSQQLFPPWPNVCRAMHADFEEPLCKSSPVCVACMPGSFLCVLGQSCIFPDWA